MNVADLRGVLKLAAEAVEADPDEQHLQTTFARALLRMAKAKDRANKEVAATKTQTDDDADMAAVGRALMETIDANIGEPPLKGWAPAQCPSEIVGDLLNMIDEAYEGAAKVAETSVLVFGEGEIKSPADIRAIAEMVSKLIASNIRAKR